jgi:hypothetical protein
MIEERKFDGNMKTVEWVVIPVINYIVFAGDS